MTELLTLAEAKAHLRVIDDTDDSLIEMYLASAFEQCESFLNRRIVADHYEAEAIVAEYPAFDAATDNEIEYSLTYPTPIVVNSTIKCAALLVLGNLFENRQSIILGTISSEIPMGFKSLLMPYRVNMGV